MQQDTVRQPIQESSGIEDRTGKLSRPDSASLVTRTSDAEWESSGTTGFSYKPLFEDAQARLKTMLMKVEAGALAVQHNHDQLEQVLVLEGEFYDEYRNYGPGDFIVRAPGAMHTGGSKNGAVVLLIYSN